MNINRLSEALTEHFSDKMTVSVHCGQLTMTLAADDLVG